MSTRDWQRDMETCQKASPGPWRPGGDGRIYCSKGYYVATIYKLLTPDGLADDVVTTNANMQLIAEAREALPYWLQRVRELEDELERVKKLEAVAEAAQEFLDTISLAEHTGADVIMPPMQWQALYKLREALAALDDNKCRNCGALGE